jgi:hypothetical protein
MTRRHPTDKRAPDENTKQNPRVIKKEGGRRPPSKMTRQHPTDKRAPDENTIQIPLLILK